MSNADDVRQLVAEISVYIARAKEALGQGVLVDLAGLDSQIKLLCDEIVQMPVGDSRPFREVLSTLSDELSELRDALDVTKQEVQEQLKALNQGQKAAHAYKSTEMAEARAVTPKNPEGES